MLTKRSLFIALIALAALNATSAMAGPAGTTITLTKTASSDWTRIDTYDWTIEKTPQFPDQVTYVVLPGETVQAGFTVKATRSGPSIQTYNTPVAGQICIQNIGSRNTQNLYVVDQLEVLEGGNWVAAAPQITIPITGEVVAGEEDCYNYSIPVTIDPTKDYRNRVSASIDNFFGHEGTNWTVEKSENVFVTANFIDVRESVTVRDTFLCSIGFECSSTWTDQTISSSQTFTYVASVKNVEALCGETFTMTNTASLDFGAGLPAATPVEASATATFYSGTCRTPPTL